MRNQDWQLCFEAARKPLGKSWLWLFIFLSPFFAARTTSAQVLGDPIDISHDFQKMEQVYFVGSRVVNFDLATGSGTLQWDRYLRSTTLSFNKVDVTLVKGRATEFPGTEYDENPQLPFSVTFVSPRTIRLRLSTHAPTITDAPSLMLAGPPPRDNSWRVAQDDKAITYTSAYGRVVIVKNPWHVEFYDGTGRLVPRTQNLTDPHTHATPA